ncbi:CCR4-NOT transcription complex subunit 4 [Cryptococcus neoformans Tu401-1]|nr:CCR4-NOT transcription complex subunit 4 [Cryptococcus neoformans var. grubii Tu401-1]
MPLPSIHPLPPNPTTGHQPLASLGGTRSTLHPPPASASSAGVSRETLKSLQDVYWSDDEDDPDCLLCAEPLDLSDLNFKPCQCGLQICQFCYNKLLSTDSRCPGCRRPYDTKAVVFQPVDWEEVKKAKEKKAKKAKTIKQLTAIGRRHLLGVRIVMKNMVYVVGMKLPAIGDEALSVLRSNDYFGQYGKISKLYLADLKSSTSVPSLGSDNSESTGIYIVYIRREDAARCISSLDGIPAPQGPPGAVLKASYGTARYCETFLKGGKCDYSNCHGLHEWGGESDTFTKEDMEIALTRPSEYDARQKQQSQAQPQQTLPSLSSKIAWPKPSGEDGHSASSATGLPSAASWGKGIGAKIPGRGSAGAIARPTKANGIFPLSKNNAAFPLPTPSPTVPIIIKEKKEKKSATMARARSTDSTQSATPSSNQTSPKRKANALPNLATTKSTAPPASVPPLSRNMPPSVSAPIPVLIPSSPAPAPEPEPVSEGTDGSADEHLSAESDAGPSSESPAPQTPAHIIENIPPPPVSSKPIIIHSPYPEPVIFPFPADDKDFAFVLGLDDGELQRMQAQAEGYEPSPFSKTLEGLAELGVHAPEIPDLFVAPTSPPVDHYSGLFRPFEADEPSPAMSNNAPGPSRMSEDDHNAQRTESRFGFARASVNVPAQSPFSSARRSVADLNLRDGWYRNSDASLSSHAQHDANNGAFAAQMNSSFPSSYDSTTGVTDNGWNGESVYSASPSLQRQNVATVGLHGYDVRQNGRLEQTLLQGQYMQKGIRDREEYDNTLLAMLQYGNPPQLFSSQHHQQQQQQQRAIFSPDSTSHALHEDGPFQSPMAFSQLQQAQQTPLQHHPDARQLMQMHQRRGQSPAPLTAHGYRRF